MVQTKMQVKLLTIRIDLMLLIKFGLIKIKNKGLLQGGNAIVK